MRHYICTGGCDGQASVLGVCQTETCEKEGEALTSCDCEDGTHAEAKKGDSEKETEDTE